MKNVCLNNNCSVVNFASRQRGASLLEGIAYLGIAALVILGAVSLLTGAFTSAQSNRGAEELVSIRTAVKKLYVGQSGSYGTASLTGALHTARIFPSTLNPNAAAPTAMINAWGGDVTVSGSNAGATFTIKYTSVPQDACISMLSGANGWTYIQQTNIANAFTYPLSPANATTICSAASNSIELSSN